MIAIAILAAIYIPFWVLIALVAFIEEEGGAE
jgi:hypothetical protein